MLLPPKARRALKTVGDTNLIDLRHVPALAGMIGAVVDDGQDIARRWFVRAFYKADGPLGLRVKLTDGAGTVAFVVQRDFEVLAGLVSRGDRCLWGEGDYPGPLDPAWRGLRFEGPDRVDDLYERERELRSYMPPGTPLPAGFTIVRRYHSYGRDYAETLMIVRDAHPRSQLGPDAGYATLLHRWASVERERL